MGVDDGLENDEFHHIDKSHVLIIRMGGCKHKLVAGVFDSGGLWKKGSPSMYRPLINEGDLSTSVKY